MLVFIAAITGAKRWPPALLRRGWLAVAFVVVGLCMVLTYSRGASAHGGAGAPGLQLPAHAAHLFGGVGCCCFAGGAPVHRPSSRGCRARPGNADALWRVPRRRDAHPYPWFGVGFAGTPDIISRGVNVIFVGEEMGLMDWRVRWRWGGFRRCSSPHGAPPRMTTGPIMLGCCLAAGAMVSGLDHIRSISTLHAAALLWLVVGLGRRCGWGGRPRAADALPPARRIASAEP